MTTEMAITIIGEERDPNSGNKENENTGDTDDGSGGGNVPNTPSQSVPPAPTGATVDGNKLVLTYNEPLGMGSVPTPGDFHGERT